MSFLTKQAQEVLDALKDKAALLRASGDEAGAKATDFEYAKAYKNYMKMDEAVEPAPLPPGDLAIGREPPRPVQPEEPGFVQPTSESLGADMSSVDPTGMQRKTFGTGAALTTAGGLGLAGSYVGEDGQPTQMPAKAVEPEQKPEVKPTPQQAQAAAKAEPATPSIPYRKVRNYLDDLGAAPEYDATQFNDRLDTNQLRVSKRAEALKAEIDSAMALHNTATDKLEKRELMETIMHGIGLIVAGMHGVKTGQDMSGVKFTPTDWARKAAAQQSQLQNMLTAAKEKYKVDEDTLNRERANILQNKEDANRQYADLYRKWEHQGMVARDRTNYEQEERNYQDMLKRFDIEMAARAEKASDKPDMQIDALAKERETEIDNLKKQWRVGAAQIAKLKGDAQDAKLEELKMLDETITAQTGLSMLPNAKLYEEPKQFMGGIDYDEVLTEANKHQEQLNALAKTNPKAASLISQRNTAIKQYTQQAMAQGLSLRDADAVARANYRKYLNTLLSNKGSN